MNVVSWVIWGIILDDPVHAGYIKTTSGNVRAQESAGFGVAKLKERRCPLLLFLFTLRNALQYGKETIQIRCTDMKVEDRDVDVVEQLAVILYGVTTREEDDNLFLHVLFQKGEEEEEAAVGRANDVTLSKSRDSTCRLSLIDIDLQRARSQGHPGEVGTLLVWVAENSMDCRSSEGNQASKLSKGGHTRLWANRLEGY
jgi:hypothetical protein